MKKPTKKEIEESLADTLDACLESCSQDGTIRSLIYNEKEQTATVVLDVHLVPEDNYIGFGSY